MTADASLPMHHPGSAQGWDDEQVLEAQAEPLLLGAATRLVAAYFALVIHVLSATTAGFLLGYGIPAGWGCVGLAGSSLIATYLLGQE